MNVTSFIIYIVHFLLKVYTEILKQHICLSTVVDRVYNFVLHVSLYTHAQPMANSCQEESRVAWHLVD